MAIYYITTDRDISSFEREVGMMCWNIAVFFAPEDTGNLRSAIYLRNNSSKYISIEYDQIKAHYIEYLEKGIGYVKKHKGFISNNTVNGITLGLIDWIKTGVVDPLFTVRPLVVLKDSAYTPFGNERKILTAMKLSTNRINATERGIFSKLIANSQDRINDKASGLGVDTIRIQSRSRFSGKTISDILRG